MKKQFLNIYSIMMETFKEFANDHATKLRWASPIAIGLRPFRAVYFL